MKINDYHLIYMYTYSGGTRGAVVLFAKQRERRQKVDEILRNVTKIVIYNFIHHHMVAKKIS